MPRSASVPGGQRVPRTETDDGVDIGAQASLGNFSARIIRSVDEQHETRFQRDRLPKAELREWRTVRRGA